jgi:hypothetical protein
MTFQVLGDKVKEYIDHADKKSLLVVARILKKEQDADWRIPCLKKQIFR